MAHRLPLTSRTRAHSQLQPETERNDTTILFPPIKNNDCGSRQPFTKRFSISSAKIEPTKTEVYPLTQRQYGEKQRVDANQKIIQCGNEKKSKRPWAANPKQRAEMTNSKTKQTLKEGKPTSKK